MASTYTTNLGIEKIGAGEQSGTWGDTTNTNFDMIDQAVSGIVSVTLPATGSTGTPNDIDITDGTVSDGRNAFIELIDGGDLGDDAYVRITPNDAEKIVHIRNNLTGGRDVYVFQGTYNASNDYLLASGADAVLLFNGGGASATVTDKYAYLHVTAINATTYNGLPVATDSVAGIVELADQSEVDAGIDTEKAVTPATLSSWSGTIGSIGSLSDVTITSVADTELIQYNSGDGAWINRTFAEAGVAPSENPTFTGSNISFSGCTTVDGGTVTVVNITSLYLNNILVTATADELSYNDIAALGTAQNSKVLTMSSLGSLDLAGRSISGGLLSDMSITESSIGAIGQPSTGRFTTLEATGLTTLNGIKESEDNITGSSITLESTNGTIVNLTLDDTTEFTDGLSSGESITLVFDASSSGFSITWPGPMKWIGGIEPTIDGSNETIVEIFKANGQLYGAIVGVAS